MQCPHHWVIEAARSPNSWGVCKLCGARRSFSNVLSPKAQWETATMQSPWTDWVTAEMGRYKGLPGSQPEEE